MPYLRNQPTYDVIQWNGNNTQDVVEFAGQVFSCWPQYPTYYDETNNTIVLCIGQTMNVGDWVVSAGKWEGTPYREGSPEYVPADLFSVKYSQQA